jgi:hypothetical protein
MEMFQFQPSSSSTSSAPPSSGVPEQRPTVAELIVAVKSRHMRPRLPLSCPADWASLIRSCWHPDPACRPTATELKERLLALQTQFSKNNKLWDSLSWKNKEKHRGTSHITSLE